MLALYFLLLMLIAPSPTLSLHNSANGCLFLYHRMGHLVQPSDRLNWTVCDYFIQNNESHPMSLRLKFPKRVEPRWGVDEILMELYDSYPALKPYLTITGKDQEGIYSKRGTIRFDSIYNVILIRIHKPAMGQWIPFVGTYQPKGVCLYNQVKCLGEQDCYEPGQRCDGKWDCKETGFDEFNCTNCPDAYCCSEGTEGVSTSTCFTDLDRCNGRPKCINAHDQENCDPERCNSAIGAFLCENKKCIQSDWVCDSVNDCRDNSDEKHCPDAYTHYPSAPLDGTVSMIAVMSVLSCVLFVIIITTFSVKLYILRKRRLREREALTRGEESIEELLNSTQEDSDAWWNVFFCGPSRSSLSQQIARRHGQHVSPITEVQNEIFARLSAPPSYQVAMATSRSFDEVVAEQQMVMARRRQSLEASSADDEITQGAADDDMLLDPMNDTLLASSDQPFLNYWFDDVGPDGDAIFILRREDEPSTIDATDDGASSSAPVRSNTGRDRKKKRKRKRQQTSNTGEQAAKQRGRNGDRRSRRVVDEPPTFEEAVGDVCQLPVDFSATSPVGDNDSGSVPPSYSSLFPCVGVEQAAEIMAESSSSSLSSNHNISASENISRVNSGTSFLSTSLHAIRALLFSRRIILPRPSSFTELLEEPIASCQMEPTSGRTNIGRYDDPHRDGSAERDYDPASTNCSVQQRSSCNSLLPVTDGAEPPFITGRRLAFRFGGSGRSYNNRLRGHEEQQAVDGSRSGDDVTTNLLNSDHLLGQQGVVDSPVYEGFYNLCPISDVEEECP